jgi:hypothetical protein
METSLAEKISLDEETKESETTATESLNTSSVSAESNDTEVYSEEDMKKADEYKGQGNEFFKCKQIITHIYIKREILRRLSICTQKPFSAKCLRNRRLCITPTELL